VFTHGSMGFLANQDSRGLEVESVAAQPFTVLRALGIWHGHAVWRYGAYQVAGHGVDVAAKLTLASTVLALIALALWRWRMSWRTEVAGDAALVATLLMVTTSRVISVQYVIWLIGMAACALAFPRTSQRPVALLLLIVAALTQVEYPFLFHDFRAHGAAAGTAVVALRGALLLAVTLLAFARLWRSTRPASPVMRGPRAANAVTQAGSAPGRGTAGIPPDASAGPPADGRETDAGRRPSGGSAGSSPRQYSPNSKFPPKRIGRHV
jgi:hypothetical protein